jgi:hypothetical protein
MLVPTSRFNRKEDVKLWTIITVVVTAFGIVTFFGYQMLLDNWTVEYDKHRLIKGSSYTELATMYRDKIQEEQGRTTSDEELLMAAAGNREDIWSTAEIAFRGRMLAIVYLLSMLSFSIAIVAVIQVVYCNFREQPQ